MSGLDISPYIAPFADGPAGGRSCEYDAPFRELEALFEPRQESMVGDGADEEARDWAAGKSAGFALLETSRDLRVACRLSICLLYTDGLEGLANGLDLVAAFVGPLWRDIHPELDPDDGFDPLARCNAFASFADPLTKAGFEQATLAVSRMRMAATLRHVEVAAGRRAPADADDLATCNGLVADAFIDDQDAALGRLASVRRAQEACRRIMADWRSNMQALEEESGEKGANTDFTQSPKLEPLQDLLAAMERALSGRLEGASTQSESAMDDEAASNAPAMNGAAPAAPAKQLGAISSREDAARELKRIADWFRDNEPSSPAPLMIEWARRMVNRSFLDIMNELGPDGLEQLRRGAGEIE